jgi:hypothetical protein
VLGRVCHFLYAIGFVTKEVLVVEFDTNRVPQPQRGLHEYLAILIKFGPVMADTYACKYQKHMTWHAGLLPVSASSAVHWRLLTGTPYSMVEAHWKVLRGTKRTNALRTIQNG